jgi:hypothetical protein
VTTQALTKFYPKLPAFDGTELSTKKLAGVTSSNNAIDPDSSDKAYVYSPPSVADLAEICSAMNPLLLRDAELNPFGGGCGMSIEERMKGFGQSHKTTDYISSHVRSGPTSADVHALMDALRSSDLAVISKDMNNRVRARALLRLHLAVVRQNKIKAKPSATGSLEAALRNSSALEERPDKLFGNASFVQSQLKNNPKSDREILGELCFASGITVAVSVVDGLWESNKQFSSAARSILLSFVELLGGYAADVAPFPATSLPTAEAHGNFSSVGSLGSTKLAQSSFSPIVSWDKGISNNSLIFTDHDRCVSRPGSVSSYPAALCKPTSAQCSLSFILTEARTTNNWLTFGVSLNTFANNSSDGFGKQSNSW